jgi:hypothetical protein
MRIPFAQPIATLARHPHRPAGFVAGMLVPLLVAGLFMVPRLGGLSDAPGDSRPQAYVIPTE